MNTPYDPDLDNLKNLMLAKLTLEESSSVEEMLAHCIAALGEFKTDTVISDHAELIVDAAVAALTDFNAPKAAKTINSFRRATDDHTACIAVDLLWQARNTQTPRLTAEKLSKARMLLKKLPPDRANKFGLAAVLAIGGSLDRAQAALDAMQEDREWHLPLLICTAAAITRRRALFRFMEAEVRE